MNRANNKIIERFTSKGVFPHQLAFTLLIPLRNVFLSPKNLIQRLELREDLTVLEIGPGPGYFSPKIAQLLPKGKLVLADIQQEMLNYARNRIQKKGINNIEYHLCNGKTFDFPDATFDRVFMVTVLGEVENKNDYLHEIYRILNVNGILSITELAGDPDKLSKEEIVNLLSENGFIIDKGFGNKKNFTVNFKKE